MKDLSALLQRRPNSGFTLVELLVVIAIIAVLAIAVLAAIDPIEAMKKGRDSERQATASQIKNAVDAFNASQGCYPWEAFANRGCTAANNLGGTAHAISDTHFTAPAAFPGTASDNISSLGLLVLTQTVKGNITAKTSVSSDNKLHLSENTTTGVVTVCWEPESRAGRDQAAYGPTVGSTLNTGTPNCTAGYNGTGGGTCWVCVQ